MWECAEKTWMAENNTCNSNTTYGGKLKGADEVGFFSSVSAFLLLAQPLPGVSAGVSVQLRRSWRELLEDADWF